MALFSIRNERDFFAFTAFASETTAATVVSGASAGEAQIVKDSGAAPTGKGKFKFVYKHLDGRVRTTDTIDPNKIISISKQAPVSEVLPKDDITFTTSPTAGDQFEVMIRIWNDGSLGRDDVMLLNGYYTAASGDTVTSVATGLKNSLNAAQTKMGQDWFTISNSSGVLTIQSKRLPFVTGKKDGRDIDFKTVVAGFVPGTLVASTTTYATVRTALVPNPCANDVLKDLEWQTRGAFADSYRGLGYPNDFAFASDIVAGTAYTVYDILFYDGDSNDHAVQKSPRQLTIACPAASVATLDAALAEVLQTIDLSTAATDGQILKYSATTGTFAPAADA